MRNIIKIGLLCSLSCVHMPPKFDCGGRLGYDGRSDCSAAARQGETARAIAAQGNLELEVRTQLKAQGLSKSAIDQRILDMFGPQSPGSTQNLAGSTAAGTDRAARLLRSPQEEERRRTQEQLEQVRSAHRNSTTLREQDALLQNTEQPSRAIEASSGLSREAEELIQNLINDGMSRQEAVQLVEQSYPTQSDEAMSICRALAAEMGLPASDLKTYKESLSLRIDDFMKLCVLIGYDRNVLMHLTPEQANDLLYPPTVLSQAASSNSANVEV